ncbi:MAG TPA: Fe-S cluster assembly protein SufD [Kofleriaceae bacterium]|nr:Fe-S cluster assembly protein SufD [Kofleriaceae bacterium]
MASLLIDHLGQLPGGPDWLALQRADAALRLRERGLPHAKVESWRNTPVKAVTGEAWSGAPLAPVPEWARARFAGDQTERVYVVNGRPVLDGVVPRVGVELQPLAEALGDPAVQAALGRVAGADHFAGLNAALWTDGLLVRIGPGVRLERPLHVVHVAVAGASPTVAYPRLLVLAGAGSRAVLVDSYLAEAGKQLANAVTEIVLDDDARLEHVRVQAGGAGSHHVGTVAVRMQRDSRYLSRVVSLGGSFCRVDLGVTLQGSGAECQLDGVYHAGDRELVDHHTVVEHAVPHTASAEVYRGIADGTGHAVFDGTVYIRRDAKGTAAHQENRNLLMSAGAVVHTKPHLEIDADDVVASHGATVGALDDAQLFYLRARGVGAEQARAVLTWAFVASVLERISHEPLRAELGAALRARLPHGDTIEELLA